MRKSERKRKVDLPQNFNSMRIMESAKVKTFVTEKELEKMRKLRELGLSYQKIAETLGRSKITVMWHLKDKTWVEEQKERNRENAKDWYHKGNGKAWQHEAYERRKKMYEEGLLR